MPDQEKNFDEIEAESTGKAESAAGKDERPGMWAELSAATAETAASLAQALGRILAPNAASRMAGDYRSGKRLNLRRVVPYVASAFRRDKIWLRRARRGARAHQVLLALDNSQSMRDRGVTRAALEALVAVSSALSRAEVFWV